MPACLVALALDEPTQVAKPGAVKPDWEEVAAAAAVVVREDVAGPYVAVVDQEEVASEPRLH